jgi:hypothetical protein
MSKVFPVSSKQEKQPAPISGTKYISPSYSKAPKHPSSELQAMPDKEI